MEFVYSRLDFEPTTETIGLWKPNCLVLRTSSFCVCKTRGLPVTFHLRPFSCRASLAIQRLNLALVYFEKAINSIIAAKGARTSDLVPLYTEVAQIEQLRRNHHQAIQYLQQVGGLAGAPTRWPRLASGPVPRAREAWLLRRTRGWD